MDTKTILNEATGRMQKAIDHLEEELLNVRAGKASPNALNGVMVDYFGSQVPVSGAASVTVPDARTTVNQRPHSDRKHVRGVQQYHRRTCRCLVYVHWYPSCCAFGASGTGIQHRTRYRRHTECRCRFSDDRSNRKWLEYRSAHYVMGRIDNGGWVRQCDGATCR